MAAHPTTEVEAILTALSPFVSTKSHKPKVVRRSDTPVRRSDSGASTHLPLTRPRTPGCDSQKSMESLSPIKQVLVRRPSPVKPPERAAHPFTNMKICMLINLHDSMQEGEQSEGRDTVKLPRLGEPRSDSVSPSKKC